MAGDVVNAKDNDFEVFINFAIIFVGNHEQDLKRVF
jgi:hypothetical protein